MLAPVGRERIYVQKDGRLRGDISAQREQPWLAGRGEEGVGSWASKGAPGFSKQVQSPAVGECS